MSLLAVVPVLDAEIAQPCITTLCDPRSSSGLSPEDLLIVDNTRDEAVLGMDMPPEVGYYRDPVGHNLGVARSWNVGAREVLDRRVDYLVLVSAVMTFGPELHITWREQMRRVWGAPIIEATGHSWHLIAVHRECFETVGLFDPAFYPAYFEQIDWSRRYELAGIGTWNDGHGWPNVWINALSRGVAAHNEIVSTPAQPLLDYYAEKWGGPKGEETFALPWGDKPLGYIVEESIPVLAERYGLTTWW